MGESVELNKSNGLYVVGVSTLIFAVYLTIDFILKRNYYGKLKEASHGLGVTLVPTVVRGVNDRQLGSIVRLGASLSPAVRGVHFQPVSYFGRYPDAPEERYTLDELICDLSEQLDVGTDSLVPSHCDHPMCGFHGSFAVMSNNAYSTAYKGFGAPQTCTASEQLMDMLAEKAGIDRFEFRYKNVYRPGDLNLNGEPYDVYPMVDILDKMRPYYYEAVARAKAENTPEKRRGVGITCCHYNVCSDASDHVI